MDKQDNVDNNDEQTEQDEVDREQAIALPNREAMTVLAPPLISPVIKAGTADSPPADTGQGIDETNPEG